MVFEPLGTAVLPLAATRPMVSVTAQFSVSAFGTLVLKASWKAVPEAKMRVPSALGVSAEMVALPEPAETAGDAQLSVAMVVPAPFTVAVPPVLLLPAAVELDEPELPLSWVVALLLAPLPPPPPPQPASARESVESRSSCDFINLTNAFSEYSLASSREARREAERTSGFNCKPADDRGIETGRPGCATIRSREGVMPSRVVGPERISLKRNSYRTNPCHSSWRIWRNRTTGEGVTNTTNVLRNSAIHIEVLEFIAPFDELFTVL